MKALRYHSYGGPLVLDDVPEPVCGPEQVRVRTLASSVNPIDWKLHSGAIKLFLPVERPAIPGLDVVGEVLESRVAGVSVGDRVVARQSAAPGGVMAEQCVIDAGVLVPLPQEVSVEEAAGLPLAGMTALQALRDDCGMRLSGEDRRVLVVGATGGVGHFAAQIAAASGAHLTVVCRPEVMPLGEDRLIDYRQQDHFRTDAPYDLIVDCAAKAPWARFREVLVPGGRMAQPTPSPGWFPALLFAPLMSRKARFTRLVPNAKDLAWLMERVADGRLRSVVGVRLPWTRLEEAWALNRSGGVGGKIVLTFDGS